MITTEMKLKFAQEWFKKEDQTLVRITENGYNPKTKQYEVPAGYFNARSFIESIQFLQSGKTFVEMEQEGNFISDQFIESALKTLSDGGKS